jgi:hypothetical protein
MRIDVQLQKESHANLIKIQLTVGLTLGIFVTVGYIVGDPVGCIPGKHSLLASLLFLKSQQAAIAHIDLLSSYA